MELVPAPAFFHPVLGQRHRHWAAAVGERRWRRPFYTVVTQVISVHSETPVFPIHFAVYKAWNKKRLLGIKIQHKEL